MTSFSPKFPSGKPDPANRAGGRGLSVWVWGINYAPEEIGIAPYNTDTCRWLQQRGCRVSMLTAFPYYPHWKKRAGDRWRMFRAEEDQGVRVYRCGLYVPARPTALRRMLHEASFALLSFFVALFLPRPQAIVVVSPPLLLGLAARVLSFLRRTSYILHVQDMQPDAAIQMGFLRPGPLTSLLYRVEAIGYGGAVQVSGITPGMVNLFREKGVPASKLALFPNWEIGSASEGQQAEGASPSFRRTHGIPDEAFLLSYSGNLGRKQGLSILVDAARILKETTPGAIIVIAGDGGEKPLLAERVGEANLPNVKLLPLLPPADYRALLRETDLALVTQEKGSGALFFPSKLLRILSAARPVLAVAEETSELARAIQEGGFGACVPPGAPEELATLARALSKDRSQLAAMAARGQRWLRRFDRQVILERFYENLRAISDGETFASSRSGGPLAHARETSLADQ